MSAKSGGNSARVSGGGGGSVSDGSEAGESSQSTMSVTDSPSTSFQANHESNITKINVAEESGSGTVHVDMTGSKVNLTLDETQSNEGMVNMGFDNEEEGANRGDDFKSINGSTKTDKVSEAVNLELVNMVPYSNGNGVSYGVPVNGIPVKKDSEGADISSPYDEYFVPVNEHKKYMRGEKLYVTKDKRRPASWRRCLTWIVACAVVSVVLIVAILAGTGVILSQDDSNVVKEASIGRNFAGGNTKPLGTDGILNNSSAGQWLSHANNRTHMYVPRAIELGLPLDNLEWNSAYMNINSSEYKQLSDSTVHHLKMILFGEGKPDTNAVNFGLSMVNISQNPLELLYRMGWNFKQGSTTEDPITMDSVKKRLVEYLGSTQGYIDRYHIDMNGIRTGGVVNICQVNNGGCSHICYYNYLNQQFTCTCPTNLILDSSMKTCVEWSESSEQDYAQVPSLSPHPEVQFESSELMEGGHDSHDHSHHQEVEHAYKVEPHLHSALSNQANSGSAPHLNHDHHNHHINSGDSSSEPIPKSGAEPEPQPEPEPEPTASDSNMNISGPHSYDHPYGVIQSGTAEKNLKEDQVSNSNGNEQAGITEPIHDTTQHQSNIEFITSPHYHHNQHEHDHVHGEHDSNEEEKVNHNFHGNVHADSVQKMTPEDMGESNHGSIAESNTEPSAHLIPSSHTESPSSSGIDSISGIESVHSLSPTSINQERVNEHQTGNNSSDIIKTNISHTLQPDENTGDQLRKHQEPTQSVSRSESDNHDSLGHHHVPLLEEILLEDSSPKSMEPHGEAHFNSSEQNLLLNGVLKSDGKPVTEEIVVDNSSPQRTESNLGFTTTPDNMNFNSYSDEHHLATAFKSQVNIHDHTDPSSSTGVLVEQPSVQDEKHDHQSKVYDSADVTGFNEQKNKHITIIPGLNDDQAVLGTPFVIQEKVNESENANSSAVYPTENTMSTHLEENTQRGFSQDHTEMFNPTLHPVTQTQIFETTVDEEKSPVKVNSELFVNEPEPKVKTRIEHLSSVPPTNKKGEQSTKMPDTYAESEVANNISKIHKTETLPGSEQNGVTVSEIENSGLHKQEEGESTRPSVLNPERNESQHGLLTDYEMMNEKVSKSDSNQSTSGAINFDKEAMPAMSEPQDLDTVKEGKTELEYTTDFNKKESNRPKQDEPNIASATQTGTKSELNNTEKPDERDLLMPHTINIVTSSSANGETSTHNIQDNMSQENFKSTTLEHQLNEPKTESPESADEIVVEGKPQMKGMESTSQIEMTTGTHITHKAPGKDIGKDKADEITGTTEYFLTSQKADNHQSTPLSLGITHSEDFSNNIKDEGIDNDEFNTLIDKEYRNEYSNDGKEHFNKYPNKQTFLKGDKKKVKDIAKVDKTGLSKSEGEDVNKHYISGEDNAHQTHVPDTGFDSEFSFHTEHTTTRSRKPTMIDAEGIPVLHFGTYDPHNSDISFLHTVSPGFESETEVPNNEGFILKTGSNDGLYDSKEDDLKNEKDSAKLDKDHKYDKQKGGKKKDLKKKGSTKDGKNVELDENRKYHTEIIGVRTESPYADGENEQFKGSSDVPAVTTIVNKINGNDTYNNKEVNTMSSHVENTDAGHPKQLGNEKISGVATSTSASEVITHDPDMPPMSASSKPSTIDPLVTGKSSDSTVNTSQFGEGESNKPAVTEIPNLVTKETKESKNKSIEKIKSESPLIREDASVEEKESGTAVLSSVEKQLKNIHGHETPTVGTHGSVSGSGGGMQDFVTASAPVLNGVVNVGAGRGHAPLSREMSSGNSTSFSSSNVLNGQQPGVVAFGEVNTPTSTSNGTLHIGKSVTSNSQHSYSRPLEINSGTPLNGMTARTFTSQESILDDGKTLREHQLLNEKRYFTHPTSSLNHGVDTSRTNEDSTIYLKINSSSGSPSVLIHNQGDRDIRFPSTSYTLDDDKIIKRVFNITTIPRGHEGPYFVRNVTFATGNGNKSELNPALFFKGHNDLLQNGQEFRYNTTHTFIAPPGNFSFGNHTSYKIDFDSKPETTLDERFSAQDGQYKTYTNSSGTFVYSSTQPSFVIKGNSGDFGRSVVYILGNNSKSNAFSIDSSSPMRSHHVIFKNSTVFAVRNTTNDTVGTPIKGLEPAKVITNGTTKKSFQLTPSSLAADTVLKVGDYFGYISKCAAGEFQCLNGTSKRGYACINLSSKCDSINDCSDGSDEAGCIENNCPGNFQCSDGTCLKRHLVCNGIVECSDGSDEKQCENWKCEFDEIKCPSGRCIPVVWQCDGKADCDNHTDEQNCQRSCGNDEYLCPEGWCVPLTYKCNGIKECTNGEDEQLCDCSHEEFKCQAGGCVPKAQVCNGLDDCPDRSDEWNCMQLQSNSTLLQIRTPTGDFEPVCSDNWSHDFSDNVCASLGYSVSTSSDHEASSIPFTAHKSFFKLKNGTFLKYQNSLVNLMRTNGTCASQKWVEISCQEFSCGSRSMTDGSSVEGRLVGGMGATAGQWPSVALLYNVRNMHSCTANILTPRWVLASYNCLKMGNKNLNEKDWKLFGGSTVFDMEKESGETRKIMAIVPHPQVKFNQFLFSNDLALVKLEEPLPFSSNMGAVCLPEQEIQPRQICVTAGWGMNGPEDKNIKQQLQYLPVPTMNLTECNSTEHYSGFVTDDKICAGYNTAEKSLCYNEEGAPLMCVNDRGEWELQGTLSYHSDCGRGSHPSIFSSIKPVKDWIRQTIGNIVERKGSRE